MARQAGWRIPTKTKWHDAVFDSAFDRPQRFADIREVLDYHNHALIHYYQADPLDFDVVLEQARREGEQLLPMMGDVTARLHEHEKQGQYHVEGPGDCWMTTAPIPTPSRIRLGYGYRFWLQYFVSGLWLGLPRLTRPSRFGAIFNRIFDAVGQRLAERGHEFGATTDARVVGWFGCRVASGGQYQFDFRRVV